MPKSNSDRNLKGTYAQAKTRDAYGSQSFDDQERVGKLGALLVLNLANFQLLTANVNNEVNFGIITSKLYSSPFARSFAQIPNSNKFICQKSCTARITFQAEVFDLGAGQSMSCFVFVYRAPDEIRLYSRRTNTDASVTGSFSVGGTNIVDLRAGDVIYMQVYPGTNTATLNGAGTATAAAGGTQLSLGGTYLLVEEVDL